MRFGPATRTAFAGVNLPLPLRATRRHFKTRFDSGRSEVRLYWPTLSSGGAIAQVRCSLIAFAGCSPAMRNRFSEEAATPGCPQRLHALGTARQFTLVNCRRTNFRNHWQRNVHACSESTFSHPRDLSKKSLRPGCANPVDDESSLWKELEKRERTTGGGLLG